MEYFDCGFRMVDCGFKIKETGDRSQESGERQLNVCKNCYGLYDFNDLSDAMRYALCAMRISIDYLPLDSFIVDCGLAGDPGEKSQIICWRLLSFLAPSPKLGHLTNSFFVLWPNLSTWPNIRKW